MRQICEPANLHTDIGALAVGLFDFISNGEARRLGSADPVRHLARIAVGLHLTNTVIHLMGWSLGRRAISAGEVLPHDAQDGRFVRAGDIPNPEPENEADLAPDILLGFEPFLRTALRLRAIARRVEGVGVP